MLKNTQSNNFNNKKFQATKELGKSKLGSKVMSYSEGSQFSHMQKRIQEGR